MEQRRRKTEELGDLEEDIKEMFPALYREIKENDQWLKESETRTSHGTKKIRKFAGYIPGVIDYLCRCETDEEAREIIEYMLKRGEITEEYASELLKQLEEQGLESFGEHRTAGYYERA